MTQINTNNNNSALFTNFALLGATPPDNTEHELMVDLYKELINGLNYNSKDEHAAFEIQQIATQLERLAAYYKANPPSMASDPQGYLLNQALTTADSHGTLADLCKDPVGNNAALLAAWKDPSSMLNTAISAVGSWMTSNPNAQYNPSSYFTSTVIQQYNTIQTAFYSGMSAGQSLIALGQSLAKTDPAASARYIKEGLDAIATAMNEIEGFFSQFANVGTSGVGNSWVNMINDAFSGKLESAQGTLGSSSLQSLLATMMGSPTQADYDAFYKAIAPTQNGVFGDNMFSTIKGLVDDLGTAFLYPYPN
ncbi:MAG: hypothetical protein JSS32_07440 [Verrucomicrobia bacterium]|nr:hypothetical protein [Verrucomicrobiota bacterium]